MKEGFSSTYEPDGNKKYKSRQSRHKSARQV